MKERRLWLQPGEEVANANMQESSSESYNEIFDRCAVRPQPQALSHFLKDALVVGQELILSCMFLACHRAASSFGRTSDGDAVVAKLEPSMVLIWLALFLVVIHNHPSTDGMRTRKTKARHRATDGVFMAIVLRFLAAVLGTLTASYSTDTVHALAISSFVLHLLACDYSYANGEGEEAEGQIDAKKRPAFRGGTLSLTAAFFGTTLLASRLQSNLIVYGFVSSSVVLFAFYPASRHQISINTATKNQWVPFVITALLAGAAMLLLTRFETILLFTVFSVFCGVAPCWKYILQKRKVSLQGPWVLIHPQKHKTE